MAQVNAYLHFQDNCRQAMTFYKECLGGELTLMTVGESPMAAQVPPEAKDQIMHSLLKNGNIVLMASDNMGSGTITKGNQFSMTIECGSKKEADSFYAKLSAGGKPTHPMKDEFFGYYGDLTDKFGINWMISHMKPQS
ncbi:MAG: VOC family protein [Spirochaetia bacterium]